MLLRLPIVLSCAAAAVLASGETPEQRHFIAWLEDFLSSPSTTKKPILTRYHSPGDHDYCKRYKLNYKRYCMAARETEMLGVLAHFCKTYDERCYGEGPSSSFETHPQALNPFYTPTEESIYCHSYKEHYGYFCSSSEEPRKGPKGFCYAYRQHCNV